MNSETLLRLLRLALRALEVFLQRRAVKPLPPTRADKIVERVAPLAEKVLGQPSPASVAAPRRQRAALAPAIVLGAVVSGTAAYIVLKQQRRVRERYRRLDARLPEELLDVLAAPGGGGRLQAVYGGEGLLDSPTGLLYPVIDGIPDFLAAPKPDSALVDEAYLDGLPNPEGGDDLKLSELLAPVRSLALGDDRSANAALAGAVASLARSGGWALSVPCGPGEYEIEMARVYPYAHILCIDDRWDALLETRRKARAAGLDNLYFARGDATLLPVQDHALEGVWMPGGFHLPAAPEKALTQTARVAKSGALVAGVTTLNTNPRALTALARSSFNLDHYIALIAAAGLTEARVFQRGMFVRFIAVRE
jgi:precorrin-6B methylase 2/uncharacterized protein YbaR (Trm112 family)